SNLLYLPLDKIMQSVSQQSNAAAGTEAASGNAAAAPAAVPQVHTIDPRARDANRSRERDSR
nr:protease modulator HflK [Comamonas sp.]